ncbi:hypothetical protein HDU92_008525, partial [Lobulomyces angularis]
MSNERDSDEMRGYLSKFFNKKSNSLEDSWDENCFLKLMQTKEGRALGLDPKIKLYCISKKVDEDLKNHESKTNFYLKKSEDFDDVMEHLKSMSKEFKSINEKKPPSNNIADELSSTYEINLTKSLHENRLR